MLSELTYFFSQNDGLFELPPLHVFTELSLEFSQFSDKSVEHPHKDHLIHHPTPPRSFFSSTSLAVHPNVEAAHSSSEEDLRMPNIKVSKE